MVLTALHVHRRMPAVRIGGTDLHVLDLIHAQAEARGTTPGLLEVGDGGLAASLRNEGIEAHALPDLRSPYASVEMEAIVARVAPDIVHTHGYDADRITAEWRDRFDHPAVAAVAMVHGSVMASSDADAARLANEVSLSVFDEVLAASSGESTRLSSVLGRPVHFVPNGVRVPTVVGPRGVSRLRRFGDVGPATRFVGFGGRLSPEKRPDLFVAICELLLQRGSDIVGLMAGSGPEAAAVRDRIERSRLDSRLFPLGHVQDMDSFFPSLDVLLCTSDTETTPRVILEAMARRVPVVATEVGGVPDIIREGMNGMLFTAGDAAAGARAVERLLTNPALHRRLAAAGRRTVLDRFTIQRMEERIHDIYASALARRHRMPADQLNDVPPPTSD